MNIIEHCIEPTRLLLTWQAINGATRKRHVVGELVRKKEGVRLTYLTEGLDMKSAVENGFQGYPAFRKTDREHLDGVLETFMKRLPPRSRGDFNKYLNNFRLPSDASISDFALLGYTEAKLPGDGFSIINPFDDVMAPCELLTEIAGYRHYMEKTPLEELVLGGSVIIEPEPQNEYDSDAVSIKYKNNLIGYINRGQTHAFNNWMSKFRIEATIERINGKVERPLIYLFVKVMP